MGLKERSELRRTKIRSHRSSSHAEAEKWDLEFWQEQTPEDRLSALVAILQDIEKVESSKKDKKS